jgi:hypothetical protein
VLAAVGIYHVSFSVPVDEPGQLELTLNGIPLAYTVTGRSTGTSAIAGEALVQTTLANGVLTVRNPAGESSALRITPVAGGTERVLRHAHDRAAQLLTRASLTAGRLGRTAGLIRCVSADLVAEPLVDTWAP